VTKRGSGRWPSVANAAYAAVSSSGVTSAVPSTTDGCDGIRPRPNCSATPSTRRRPTSLARRTVGTFFDCDSACRMVTAPENEPS
jgi:hypothetical protein